MSKHDLVLSNVGDVNLYITLPHTAVISNNIVNFSVSLYTSDSISHIFAENNLSAVKSGSNLTFKRSIGDDSFLKNKQLEIMFHTIPSGGEIAINCQVQLTDQDDNTLLNITEQITTTVDSVIVNF